MIATGLTGAVWAQTGTAKLSIASPTASGRVARTTATKATASLKARGNSGKNQGATLYEITDIARGFENKLTVRLYVLNPEEMGLAFGEDRTELELTVTDFSDPNIVYASATASADKARVTLLPRGAPAGIDRLKLRGSIVIPGNRAKGAEEPKQPNLDIFVEVSHR